MINNNDIKSLIIQLNNIEIIDWMWVFKNFRDKIKNIFSTKYVVLTNNWTSALYLSYKSIWLKKWDEVITCTYTYHSTNTTLLNFTNNIIFCDIDENITIDINQIKSKISDKTKLLIIPYTWWLSPNMNTISDLKNIYKNLTIIEDCSQAHFWKYDNKLLWTFWDIWVFSMQWWKLLPAWEWWFAITNNKYLYETMLVNSDSWKTLDNLLDKDSPYRDYIDTWLWMKFRPNPFWIALANSKLESIKDKINTRIAFSDLVKNELKDIKSLNFIHIENHFNSSYALIAIYKNEIIKIDELLEIFHKNWITDIYRPKNNKPNHLLKIFENIKNQDLSHSEYIYNNLLYFKLYDSIDYKNKVTWYINIFKEIINYYKIW